MSGYILIDIFLNFGVNVIRTFMFFNEINSFINTD